MNGAGRERVELSPPTSKTLYFTGVDDLAEHQSSPQAGVCGSQSLSAIGLWGFKFDHGWPDFGDRRKVDRFSKHCFYSRCG